MLEFSFSLQGLLQDRRVTDPVEFVGAEEEKALRQGTRSGPNPAVHDVYLEAVAGDGMSESPTLPQVFSYPAGQTCRAVLGEGTQERRLR